MDHFAVCLDGKNGPVWVCNLMASASQVTGWELPNCRRIRWCFDSFRSLSPIDWFYVHNNLLEGGCHFSLNRNSLFSDYSLDRHFLFRDELDTTDEVVDWFRMIADQRALDAINFSQNRDLNEIHTTPHPYGAGIDRAEFSAVGYSITVNNMGFFCWAIEHGGSIECGSADFGQTGLHLAAFSNSIAFLRPCLRRTSVLNIIDMCGISPLCIAVRNQFLDHARLLLSAGADPNFGGTDQECGEENYPVLNRYSLSMFSLLLQHRADFNRIDHSGNTALHLNARSLSRDVFIALVDAGVDPHQANKEGETPFEILRDNCGESLFNQIFTSCRQ